MAQKLVKPHDIRWPVTARTLEDINANFDAIFRALASGNIGSSSSSSGSSGGVTNHEALSGLQGGAVGEHYHVLHKNADGEWDTLGVGTAPEAGSVMKVGGHYYAVQHANGNSGAAKTIDWSLGNGQTLTLTADCTLTFSNGKAGAHYVLILVQDSGAPRLVTWPAVTWSGGITPALSEAAGGVDLVALYYDGTRYIAAGYAPAVATLPENPLSVAHGGTGHFEIAEGELFVGKADGTLMKLAAPTATGQRLLGNLAVAGKMGWGTVESATSASVYSTTDTTCPAWEWVTLAWDAEHWDTASYHSTSVNNSRFTVTEDGIYLVSGVVWWPDTFVGGGYLRILKNGATSIGESAQQGLNVPAPYGTPQDFSFLVQLSATDYVELQTLFMANPGWASIVVKGGATGRSMFQITRIM